MIEIDRDLKDMIICALRYSLGRRTYIVGETSEYIISHPELIDSRVKQVMLNDLNKYLEDRQNCYVHDDDCDFNYWMHLKNWLENFEIK